MNSSIQQDAVLRNLEIIGEAVKHLSGSLKESHPDTSWRQIAGLRDLLIHHYMGVDLEEVWNIVVGDIPRFKVVVMALCDELQNHA